MRLGDDVDRKKANPVYRERSSESNWAKIIPSEKESDEDDDDMYDIAWHNRRTRLRDDVRRQNSKSGPREQVCTWPMKCENGNESERKRKDYMRADLMGRAVLDGKRGDEVDDMNEQRVTIRE